MLKLILQKNGQRLDVPIAERVEIPLHNTRVGNIIYGHDGYNTWDREPDPRMHITIEMYGTPGEARELVDFIECPARDNLPRYRPPALLARRPASGRALLALATLLVLATLAIGALL